MEHNVRQQKSMNTPPHKIRLILSQAFWEASLYADHGVNILSLMLSSFQSQTELFAPQEEESNWP